MPDDPQQLPAGDHKQQHNANGKVKVLGTDAEAERQAKTEHADHQRSQRGPDDGAFPAGGKRTAQHHRCDDGKRIGRTKVILG